MDLEANLRAVQQRIEAACARAGREPGSVTLVAVTKTQPPEVVCTAAALGLSLFGESKVQEAGEKIPAINALHGKIKWHFIGHLQTNKASKAVKLFSCIQSIDSLRLAEKVSSLAAAGKPIEALLEIKVSDEDSKSGILPGEAGALIEGIKKLPGIKVTGLMTMAPYSDNPESARPYFKKAKSLFDELKRTAPGGNVTMETLSMGMSGDYIVAIEEGATMVRIGSAIFGERSY
jgi:PLP dependent protein